MKWYALFVLAGKEERIKRRVQEHLGLSDVKCCVPKREVPEMKNGILLKVVRTIFPGYVFIQAKLDNNIYYKLNEIPDVIKLLNYTNKKDKIYSPNILNEDYYFKSIPDDEMRSVLSILNDYETIEYSSVLVRNKRVIVMSGPLKGKEGKIKKIDKRKNRAKLAMNFLGDEILIDIGLDIVMISNVNKQETEVLGNGGFSKIDLSVKIEGMVNLILEVPQSNVVDNELVTNGLNSLNFIHLMVNIENKFGIEIPDEFLSMEKLSTINSIVDYIQSKQN
ncbi:hypothetical protein PMSD_25095 [Paenibacillus macquariensis subsp. defensor]|nr:hypothetical protein PMSD_25095 [Paenibacillus macquariensis subsp. defensor]